MIAEVSRLKASTRPRKTTTAHRKNRVHYRSKRISFQMWSDQYFSGQCQSQIAHKRCGHSVAARFSLSPRHHFRFDTTGVTGLYEAQVLLLSRVPTGDYLADLSGSSRGGGLTTQYYTNARLAGRPLVTRVRVVRDENIACRKHYSFLKNCAPTCRHRSYALLHTRV